MAKQTNDPFEGFTQFGGQLTGEIPILGENSYPGSSDVPELEMDEDGNPIVPNNEEENDTVEETVEPTIPEVPEMELPEDSIPEEETPPEEPEEEGIDLAPHFNLISQELFGEDFDEENAPENWNSVEGFAGFIKSIVEENSKPEYADETVEKFDTFVKQGGDPKQFISVYYEQPIDFDNLDDDDESVHEFVIKKALEERGYRKDRIDKQFRTYEDSGIIKEMYEDEKEFLIKNNKKRQEKLLLDQEKIAEQQKTSQLNFVNTVQKNVTSSEDIFGIPVTKADKEKVIPYLYKPGKNGLTPYQEEYQKDPEKFMAELGLLLIKRDTLLSMIDKKAKTTAAQNFRKNVKKQKSKSSSGTEGNPEIADSTNAWSTFAKKLRG